MRRPRARSLSLVSPPRPSRYIGSPVPPFEPERRTLPAPVWGLLMAPFQRAHRGLREHRGSVRLAAARRASMTVIATVSQMAAVPHVYQAPSGRSSARLRDLGAEAGSSPSIASHGDRARGDRAHPAHHGRELRARSDALGVHGRALRGAGRRRHERLGGARPDGAHGARRQARRRVGLADGREPRGHRRGRGAHHVDDHAPVDLDDRHRPGRDLRDRGGAGGVHRRGPAAAPEGRAPHGRSLRAGLEHSPLAGRLDGHDHHLPFAGRRGRAQCTSLPARSAKGSTRRTTRSPNTWWSSSPACSAGSSTWAARCSAGSLPIA